MPRPKVIPDALRQCQGCPQKLPVASFKHDKAFCDQCWEGRIGDAVAQRVDKLVGGEQAVMIREMAESIQGNDPQLPEIMGRLRKALGGHDGFMRSMERAIAHCEDRLIDGQVVDYEEALKKGFGKIKDRKALFAYHKLVIQYTAKMDEHRMSADPFKGMNAKDMMATVRKIAKDHLKTDPEHRQWVIGFLCREFLGEMMVAIEKTKAIPAEATTVG